MKEGLVSIVVPVYNVEDYLQQCVDSLLNQTYPNIEIILVNDGSTDTSDEICRRYAEKEERILYLEQENAGVSVARNSGLQAASGEFVLFADPDDLIPADTCQTAVKKAENYDVVIFDHLMFRDLSEIPAGSAPCRNITDLTGHSVEDWVRGMLVAPSQIDGVRLNSTSAWGKLYRRTFLEDNRLVFTPGLYFGEDQIFNLQVYLHTPRIAHCDAVAYYYRYNSASIVHRYNPNFAKINERFYQELQKYLGDGEQWEGIQEPLAYRKLGGLLMLLTKDVFHPDNPKSTAEKKQDFLEEVRREEYAPAYGKWKRNFPMEKRLVLRLAIGKQYGLLRVMFTLRNGMQKLRMH